jgi:hypothetical protein
LYMARGVAQGTEVVGNTKSLTCHPQPIQDHLLQRLLTEVSFTLIFSPPGLVMVG